MATQDLTQQAQRPVCDICHQAILADERFLDDGSEIVHVDCYRQWFSRNFGRESLS